MRSFRPFKAFWIEKPAANASSIVVHALLDSESAAAAYRFTIRPGETTVFDVEMAIYPRVEPRPCRARADDEHVLLRSQRSRSRSTISVPAVHDSDGLAIFNGTGRGAVAPAHNPRDLQISMFADFNPRGFGLMQRRRISPRTRTSKSRI